jgi:type II secretory pathway component PulJ
MKFGQSKKRGVSLMEVMISFTILLVAVLTLVGYTSMIHRASSESKHQAIATIEARSMLERIRDDRSTFEQAETPEGLEETKVERLLSGEVDAEDNEVGHEGAMEFQLIGRVTPVAGDFYAVVVRASWEEKGRIRQATLESRMIRPGF